METYFKKVEIHSEADLSKKEGDYYVKLKNSFSKLTILIFKPDCDNYIKDWLINYEVEWYLQPISESEQRDELREKLIKFLNDMDFDITIGLLNNEELVDKYLKQK